MQMSAIRDRVTWLSNERQTLRGEEQWQEPGGVPFALAAWHFLGVQPLDSQV